MIFFEEPNKDIFELAEKLDNHNSTLDYSFENSEMLRQVEEQSETILQLNSHKNPRYLLPPKTRFRFVKLIILKTLKVYTSIQIHFNDLVVKNSDQTNRLFKYTIRVLSDIEQKVDGINHLLSRQKDLYQSIYFDKESDKLYEHIESVFRGSENQINSRLKKYSPYLDSIQSSSQKNPFLDIGFGRGEFLNLLKSNNITNAIGVDTNKIFVSQAEKLGFKTYNQDGISFLKNSPLNFSGISMFHLLEHFAFPEIYDILRLCHNKLINQGLLILETPNPENLQVSSYSFYYDYTHKTKLPPMFLKSVLLFIGFKNINVIYSSPFKRNKLSPTKKLVYGPREYSIIAYK